MQVFNVEGMSCGHCVKAITQAVQSKTRPRVCASIWPPGKLASRAH
jgi:hypothetical protein